MVRYDRGTYRSPVAFPDKQNGRRLLLSFSLLWSSLIPVKNAKNHDTEGIKSTDTAHEFINWKYAV